METVNSANSAKIYKCELCDVECSRKNDYSRHIMTDKHIANIIAAESDKRHLTKVLLTCKNCNKEYNSRNGLWKHNKICKVAEIIAKPVEVVADITNTEIIQLLIKENSDYKKENSEFKTILVELVKSNTELQKQMVEVCKSIQPSNITTNNSNTNSHNKTTFNMQVFLNETCKDAMNMKEFVDSIKPTISDLEMVGEKGVVEGITDIILKSLRA